MESKILTNAHLADRIAYLSGAGTPNSTIALKGIEANNNTLVSCTASGLFSGSLYSASFNAVVKIQGK